MNSKTNHMPPRLSHNDVEKYGQRLLCLAVLLVLAFFLFGTNYNMAWDMANFGFWRFQLVRHHLANDFAMPYFTPARCGGFFLSAAPNDLIFSLFTLTSFLIPNVYWSVILTNLLTSIILGTGVYVWLKYFGIRNSLARTFGGILVVLSAYWLSRLTGRYMSIWLHGMAYIPWIMVVIENMLPMEPKWERRFCRYLWMLVGLFFLLINSGYIWLQVAPFIIFVRLAVEPFYEKTKRNKKMILIGIVVLCGLLAIALSLPRIGAVYEFQLTKFPRGGDKVNHMGVIGHTPYILKTYFRSFFDPTVVIHQKGEAHLGGFNEFSNYIGLAALLPLIGGLFCWRRLMQSRAFFSLFLVSILQFALTRTTHAADLLRAIVPIYNQITHNWRGSMILIFFLCVLITAAYDKLLFRSRRALSICVVVFMLLNIAEIAVVHSFRMDYSKRLHVKEIFTNPDPPPQPVTTHEYVPCTLNMLFGYNYIAKPPEVLTYDRGADVYESVKPGFYNMHDARRLASPEANGGYYMNHDWPLWPEEDKEELERFINYKQVIEIPRRLLIMNRISALMWLMYVMGFIFLFLTKRRVKTQ